MTRFLLGLLSASVLLVGCGGSVGGSDGTGGSGVVPAGEALYLEPHADAGTTFACATCHALQEPAPDGLRRPGHAIGDAANRATYKNGQLTDFREAVNTCRVEWMAAPPFAADDEPWLALSAYLAGVAGDAPGEPLAFEIVQPPAGLEGGDPMVGQDLFNESCIVCHGEDATGTQRAPALRGESLTADLIARRVRTSGASESAVYDGLTGGRMPFWAADRLSDEELLDVIAFVLSNDGGTGGGGQMQGLRECPMTHPRIGQTATLSTFAHQVSGTATIIDDCTVRIDNFVFDGQGIDVRFYGAPEGDYVGRGYSMSEEDIRRPEGYDGTELVFAQLPEDRTLDDLDGISVWCVPVSQSFGDGLFQ